MIKNIQAMRGIACFMVFCIHVLVTRGDMGVDNLAWWYYPIGSAGVDIFFVISGFIIATVAPKSANEPYPAVHFGLRRAIRIYPVYWLVFGLAVIASQFYFLSPPLPYRPLWMQALLLTHVNNRILAAWSLAFEIYFYVTVSIMLFCAPRHFNRLLVGWCIIMLTIILYCTYTRPWWDWLFPFNPLLVEFMFGVVIAFAFRANFLPFGVTAIFLGVVGLIVGSEVIRITHMEMLPPWWRNGCFGVPAAFLIYGLVAVEKRRGWTIHAMWQKLGDASYSLYICHQLVLFTLMAIWTKFGIFAHIPGPVTLLIWAPIAFVIGVSVHFFIEIPLTKKLSQLAQIRPSRVVVAPA